VCGLNFFHLTLFCSFAAAAEGKVQLEPVSQSTEDKSFTSDTAHTETTES
jgi:hypothetical protein